VEADAWQSAAAAGEGEKGGGGDAKVTVATLSAALTQAQRHGKGHDLVGTRGIPLPGNVLFWCGAAVNAPAR
jgi:hypothetical protein